jgi:hypothetical protein
MQYKSKESDMAEKKKKKLIVVEEVPETIVEKVKEEAKEQPKNVLVRWRDRRAERRNK